MNVSRKAGLKSMIKKSKLPTVLNQMELIYIDVHFKLQSSLFES